MGTAGLASGGVDAAVKPVVGGFEVTPEPWWAPMEKSCHWQGLTTWYPIIPSSLLKPLPTQRLGIIS